MIRATRLTVILGAIRAISAITFSRRTHEHCRVGGDSSKDPNHLQNSCIPQVHASQLVRKVQFLLSGEALLLPPSTEPAEFSAALKGLSLHGDDAAMDDGVHLFLFLFM